MSNGQYHVSASQWSTVNDKCIMANCQCSMLSVNEVWLFIMVNALLVARILATHIDYHEAVPTKIIPIKVADHGHHYSMDM